jgi:cytochrome P450
VAQPYPSLTIAAVLDAPYQDAWQLHAWSSWVQRQFDIRALETNRDDIERAVTEVRDYVTGLLEAKRAAPGDDLISDLLAARDEKGEGPAGTRGGSPRRTAKAGGDRLSAEECVQLVTNLLAGGIDTTAGQLAHAIRLFAARPGQWALLAAEPSLVPRAVEEVLRFEPVTPFTARICLEQVEHRDVVFPAGGENFDITAPRESRLLTFGAGIHYCLGANLARAELEEALAFLAPRTPGLALDGPPQLGGIEGIYGVDKLPITWSDSSTMSPNHGPAPDVS